MNQHASVKRNKVGKYLYTNSQTYNNVTEHNINQGHVEHYNDYGYMYSLISLALKVIDVCPQGFSLAVKFIDYGFFSTNVNVNYLLSQAHKFEGAL